MANNNYFELDERITAYLLLLKISPNLRGYSFLREGARLLLDNGALKYNVNNSFYRELSSRCRVTEDLIDRAMRHAIDVSIKRNGVKEFERRLSVNFSCGKPSPREIICTIAERVELDTGKDFKAKTILFKRF